MKGYIVYADYETTELSTRVKLFGRLENGQSFVTINTIEPYFFIRDKDSKKISKLLKDFKVEKTNTTNFEGEKLDKISHVSSTEINRVTKLIHKEEINTYEADIKPSMRFLIDHDILSSVDIQGEHTSEEKIDRVYFNPEIKPSDLIPKLKVLSIDIESSNDESQLYCIGLYSENYKKNFMVTNKTLKDTVSCKTEEECLEKFKKEFIKLDPDIITGWNVIDFDFAFLQKLFRKHKISFDLGRDNTQLRLRIEANFFRSSSVDIPGRQVMDALNLIRDPFIKEAPSIRNANFESYTLEDVSQAIIGEGKLIKGKNRHEEIEKLYKNDPQKIVDYNLQDSKLVYDILTKTKTIELALDRTQLTGLQLDRLTSSILAFDSLYIREARKRNLASPTTHFQQKEERIKGGYVYSSKSGIYHNVLIFDFKSLYPSIIKSFNIDPASYIEKKEKGAIESPNKAYFKNQQGILPEIIERLHQAREKAKKDDRELASYAIKIIMNSFFGVLASPNCRYFDLKMANAITHFGQMLIQLTAKEIEKLGYKVIYSDTDSVFVETNLEKDKANALGKKIQEHINKFYEEYVKKEHNRKSFLELEFKKQYLSMMIPKVRNSKADEDVAAKKRYAGLLEVKGKEELEITGLEAIRGDWTEAAKDFQKELLIKLFHKEQVEKFISEYIKNIKEGKVDKKLIYRKSIRKNLSEYTKTTPPHVKAARKLDKLESNVIEYYITEDGPEPIQKLKHTIDYDHYINKQIEPIANQVLSLFNKDFKEIIEKSKQTKLF